MVCRGSGPSCSRSPQLRKQLTRAWRQAQPLQGLGWLSARPTWRWIQCGRRGRSIVAAASARWPLARLLGSLRGLWAGLRAKRPRADEGLDQDRARKRAAAHDALHIALAWKGQGRLRQGVECLAPEQGEPLGRAPYVDRIASTEASPSGLVGVLGSIGVCGAAARARIHWPPARQPRWPSCTRSCIRRRPGTPRTGRQGQCRPPGSVIWSGSRLIWARQSKWTCQTVQERRTAGGAILPDQRVATDPAVHMYLDRLAGQLPKSNPASIAVATVQLLWLSVLRFQHLPA